MAAVGVIAHLFGMLHLKARLKPGSYTANTACDVKIDSSCSNDDVIYPHYYIVGEINTWSALSHTDRESVSHPSFCSVLHANAI